MKKLGLVVCFTLCAAAAQAKIPFLNAVCGHGNEVHADEGGPIYINGHEAKLKVVNDNYYEADYGRVKLSLAINPDGSPNLSYEGAHGNHGMCVMK